MTLDYQRAQLATVRAALDRAEAAMDAERWGDAWRELTTAWMSIDTMRNTMPRPVATAETYTNPFG
jgi:hypothetical protein